MISTDVTGFGAIGGAMWGMIISGFRHLQAWAGGGACWRYQSTQNHFLPCQNHLVISTLPKNFNIGYYLSQAYLISQILLMAMTVQQHLGENMYMS